MPLPQAPAKPKRTTKKTAAAADAQNGVETAADADATASAPAKPKRTTKKTAAAATKDGSDTPAEAAVAEPTEEVAT